MTDLITAGKLCKEEREKRGLSLQDVHNVTKIPVDIIRRLEGDENYLSKDPYAYFLMKVLIDFYQLDVHLTKEKETSEKQEKKETAEEKQSFFVRFLKAVFTLVAGFFVINTAVKKDIEHSNSIEHLIKVELPEKENVSDISEAEKKKEINRIVLTALDFVWLTAYVDGKEKVLRLKKGQKVKLSFKKKIRFETIGNADNLVIIYDRKKVAFERKIIHNLFVDGEGVFFNGYNLAKEES
ncbi:hypothetical protein GWK41_02065 [Persephonella atlantica]|uniref:DUF4115 domain-containing protein n=1 Tax=Persephonella atlantica TaxID=2699429 RepID=A0ABS1GG97_9AQUI|nr:helix-turn-helix domain-containing protein [Persephonella atlantica]MBK3331851.1 hypothetical protein [Persephonella atlantica]